MVWDMKGLGGPHNGPPFLYPASMAMCDRLKQADALVPGGGLDHGECVAVLRGTLFAYTSKLSTSCSTSEMPCRTQSVMVSNELNVVALLPESANFPYPSQRNESLRALVLLRCQPCMAYRSSGLTVIAEQCGRSALIHSVTAASKSAASFTRIFPGCRLTVTPDRDVQRRPCRPVRSPLRSRDSR